MPTSRAVHFSFAPRSLNSSPRFTVPSSIRVYRIIPWWLEYSKSKMRPRKLSVPGNSSRGAGIRSTTASKSFSTFAPVLPETSITVSFFTPRSFASSSLVFFISASGESILLTTGIMVSPKSRAIERVVSVWACTPCVASTSRSDPSTA